MVFLSFIFFCSFIYRVGLKWMYGIGYFCSSLVVVVFMR